MLESVKTMAAAMHDELMGRRLAVALTPAWGRHEGRSLRIVEDWNPGWYREFCAAYPAGRSRPRRRRKADTAIKRSHTLRALAEIAGGRCESVYAQRLLPVVVAQAERRMVQVERPYVWPQELAELIPV